MSKREEMEKLNKKMLECTKCVLRKTCTQVVPGEGSAESEIMFIGEGPGKKEDELGRPFVGAAGKFLDEMLGIISLKREDVYIANVVKCRPPANRDPLPEEIETCWPWLVQQIKLIDPKLIVTLGRHSLEQLIPGKKISQVHGTALRRNVPDLGTRIVFTIYHPAAALYNGGMRKTLIQDFKKIPKVIEIAKKNSGKLSNDKPLSYNFQGFPKEDNQDSLF